MKIEQRQWSETTGWLSNNPVALGSSANILFIFGSKVALKNESVIACLRADYPNAHLCGCSTAGEIRDVFVSDNTLVATAVYFEHTQVEMVKVSLNEVERNSFQVGTRLAKALNKNDLVHVFCTF